MKKKQRKKSHIPLPDDEHAKNDNGNFFICIIRFFLSNSLTYPSAQLPCPLHARLSLYGLLEIPFVVFTSEARKFRSHMRRSSLLRIHSESLIAMRCGKLVLLFSFVYLHWKVKTTTAHRYAFVCQLFLWVFVNTGLRSFRYKNVSRQVVSIQTEFNLMHQQSRFEASDWSCIETTLYVLLIDLIGVSSRLVSKRLCIWTTSLLIA